MLSFKGRKLNLKYPRLLLLTCTFIAAYFIFVGREFSQFHASLAGFGYFGTFLAGLFYTYSFTAGPATAILLILSTEQNIFLATFVAGFGALISDLFIFKFVRFSLMDEIEQLSQTKVLRRLKFPVSFNTYFFPILAGFIIASPLPDEIGIALLGACTRMSTKFFSLLSYSLNAMGIFVILLIGKVI
ncbi:MAG TPA: hypothetical protein VJK72_01750 [Candidatus Nanoarchaeia archaeon]|nr:hypothetical protein [Candidatus Nanoarchaeia archaeon]